MQTALDSTAAAPSVVADLPSAELVKSNGATIKGWKEYFHSAHGRNPKMTDAKLLQIVLHNSDLGGDKADEMVDVILSAESPNDTDDITPEAIKSVAITNRSAAELGTIAANDRTLGELMERNVDSKAFVKRYGVELAAHLFGIANYKGEVLKQGIYTKEQRLAFAVPNSVTTPNDSGKGGVDGYCYVEDDAGKYTIRVKGRADIYPTTKINAAGTRVAAKGSWYADWAMTLPWVQQARKDYDYFVDQLAKTPTTPRRAEHKGWSRSRLIGERDLAKERTNNPTTDVRKVIRIMAQLDAVNAMPKCGAFFQADETKGTYEITSNQVPIVVYDKNNIMLGDPVTITTFLSYDVAKAIKLGGTYDNLISTATRAPGDPKTQTSTLTEETWTGAGAELAVFFANSKVIADFERKWANQTMSDDDIKIIGMLARNLNVLYAMEGFGKRYHELIAADKAKEAKEAADKLEQSKADVA
jgi:hypothetical protein